MSGGCLQESPRIGTQSSPTSNDLAPTKHSVPIDPFDRNVVGAVHLRLRLLGTSSGPLSYQGLGIDVLSHHPGQRHKNRGEAYSKPGQDETSLRTVRDIHGHLPEGSIASRLGGRQPRSSDRVSWRS